MKLPTKIALAGLAASSATTSVAVDKPNIVLFLVDDMGWQDTSLPFTPNKTPLNLRYNTPNMERLAATGTKFTQAYACSISSPSRCSLLTGCNQTRHGVTNWTLHRDKAEDEPHPTIDAALWNVNGIQPVGSGIEKSFEANSFVEILRDNGYHTIHCGKAHFGAISTPSANPLNYGFNVNICGHAGGGLASYFGEQRYGHDKQGNPTSPLAIPGLEKYWDTDTFATEALTIEALEALKNSPADKPFFLYMAHYAVHTPIMPDKRFVDKYLEAGLSKTEAAYATLIEGMDKSLGDVLDFLEQNNLEDNTIVIFMSDNGGLAAHTRTAPLHVQNAPLRSGKGSAYEGGIREPMIVRWHGITAPASENSSPVIIEDFFPSILEMAGISNYKTMQQIDGKSFVPLLKGEKVYNSERLFVWNTPNNWFSYGDLRAAGIGPTCAIRKGDYKLIYWYEDGRKELYNIADDIGETTDISSKRPDIVDELSRLLGNYLRENNGQRPTFKSTGKPCPWPDMK